MTGDEQNVERVQQAIADGLAAAVATEGEMLNGWVAIVETIDANGERGLWSMAAPEMKHWQTLGFLEAAKQTEIRNVEDE